MAVDQLASSDDVARILGRALTSTELTRVAPILDKASELFRREARQQFTAATSTVRLKINGGNVVLPQSPVVEVDTVVDDDGEAVEFTQRGSTLVTCLASHEFVTVTYSHGGAVPDLVRLAVAEIAQMVLLFDEAARNGVTQSTETDGPFSRSRTYAGWAIGGSTNLAPVDVKLAQSYRTPQPRILVTSP